MTPDTHTASIEYATKADLDALRTELKADIRELRHELKGDMRELRLELKGDIRELSLNLKADMAEFKAALAQQNNRMLIAATAIFSAVVVVAKLFP